MPDGTQIGVTEMRVLAATAQNATFNYTGDNVFAYDKGIGRNTLNGTAGADVLIDNSTNGGDRLSGQGGDDYLIGGRGTNVFAPGDGKDYALIRGGAARFEVSSASPGRLEIEGFRPCTDIIALTGTVSLASILASARSDGFGGTLLTISPLRTIRLNRVIPSKISAGMFDISAAPGEKPR
jgi:Ca2+-binding RTX toxin-like protein